MQDYTILDSVFEPVVIVDESLKIIYFNHSFVPFTHLSPRQIKQKQQLQTIFLPNNFSIEELLAQCKKKNNSIVGPEGALKLIDSDFVPYNVIVKVSPLADTLFMISFNDLSIEKRLHEKYKSQLHELKETHQQILNADKLATLGELTAGISHEISNPLTIANGSCEIIEMCLEEKDLNRERQQIEQSLSDIKDAHSRINSIIINMKSYLHQGKNCDEYFQLSEIVSRSMALIGPSFNDHQVTLTKIDFDDSIVLYGNPIAFEQVLVNVFKNALYAIIHGHIANGIVSISAKRLSEGKILISVADNGPGISAEVAPNIFNTFFTTKEIGEGTGMGLSISQKIISQHMGTIELDPSYHAGARFNILLPAIEVTQFTNDQMQVNNIAKHGNAGLRVLIIERDLPTLNRYKNMFQSGLHQIYTADTPSAVLEQLKRSDFQVVLVESTFPNLDGRQALDYLQEKCQNGQVISSKDLDQQKVLGMMDKMLKGKYDA